MAYGLIQTKDGGSGYRNIDEREAAGFQISTEYGVGNHSEVHSLPKNMDTTVCGLSLVHSRAIMIDETAVD